MKDYAVIELAGKQYTVSRGSNLTVDRLDTKEGETLTIDRVLLTNINGKLSVGRPYLKDAKIKAKVVKNRLADKIRVAKFRAKSRYRKVIGHRQQLTDLTVVSL